jgi:hypothetical protein
MGPAGPTPGFSDMLPEGGLCRFFAFGRDTRQ